MSSDAPTAKGKGGKRYIDSLLASDTPHIDTDFSNCTFTNTGCLAGEFRNCNFKYTTFDRAYFRECTFEDCDFTGARFLRSNFRKIVVKGKTKFDYAFFDQTLVNARTMSQCLPGETNIKRLFCLSMRANYESLAAFDDADLFQVLQLEITTEHLKKKVEAKETYYKEHYKEGGPLRWRYRRDFYLHLVSERAWGHGLQPHRLGGWLVLALLLLAGATWWSWEGFDQPQAQDGRGLQPGYAALFYVGSTFLGLTFGTTPKTGWAALLTTLTGALGYVTLALLVAVIYRRAARR